MDQLERLQLDRDVPTPLPGPLLSSEQSAQLQLDRLQLERLQLERLQLERE